MTESNDYYNSANSPQQNSVLKVSVVFMVSSGFNDNLDRILYNMTHIVFNYSIRVDLRVILNRKKYTYIDFQKCKFDIS